MPVETAFVQPSWYVLQGGRQQQIHHWRAVGATLRHYLESGLSKVFVKGKRDLDFAPLHQRKGDAIGQGIAFIAMALKQSPALQKQRLVNLSSPAKAGT
jgi:hypothetical protein